MPVGLRTSMLAFAGTTLLYTSSITAETIEIGDRTYASWTEYWTSPAFRANGGRCGTPPMTAEDRTSAPTDCSNSQTNPLPAYDAEGGNVLEIPVVVHLITNAAGTLGQVSDDLVHAQIDVLNEDFRAVLGTAGEDGVDAAIRFRLAQTDPDGLPTTGITRTANDSYFNDGGSYWLTLGWDPKNYCNIYVNNPGTGTILGYVPFLPASGLAGSAADRIVILHSAFGRPATGGPPYNLGRTLTHEMGHFLGLHHTFEAPGACGEDGAPGCYTTGDLVCDTATEENPRFACSVGAESCTSEDPIHNYMDYSDDSCMNQFTTEQGNRMRCSMMEYRNTLYDESVPVRSSGWSSLKQAFR